MAQIMGSDLSSRMKDGGHEADDVKQVKRDRSRMIVRRRKGSAGGSVANLPVAGFPVYRPLLDRARRGKWIGATASRGGNSPLR